MSHRIAQMMIGSQHDTGRMAGFDHFLGVLQGQGQWLLAEHMLARSCGSNGLLPVEFVGRADIDHIDLRISQDSLQAPVGVRNAVVLRVLTSTLTLTTHYSYNAAVWLRIDGRNHPRLCDVTCSNQAPTKRRHCSFCAVHTRTSCSLSFDSSQAQATDEVPLHSEPEEQGRKHTNSRGRGDFSPLRLIGTNKLSSSLRKRHSSILSKDEREEELVPTSD